MLRVKAVPWQSASEFRQKEVASGSRPPSAALISWGQTRRRVEHRQASLACLLFACSTHAFCIYSRTKWSLAKLFSKKVRPELGIASDSQLILSPLLQPSYAKRPRRS